MTATSRHHILQKSSLKQKIASEVNLNEIKAGSLTNKLCIYGVTFYPNTP